jgi:hypothetical protein
METRINGLILVAILLFGLPAYSELPVIQEARIEVSNCYASCMTTYRTRSIAFNENEDRYTAMHLAIGLNDTVSQTDADTFAYDLTSLHLTDSCPVLTGMMREVDTCTATCSDMRLGYVRTAAQNTERLNFDSLPTSKFKFLQ